MTAHSYARFVTVCDNVTGLPPATDHRPVTHGNARDRRNGQAFYVPPAHEFRTPQPGTRGGYLAVAEGDGRTAHTPAVAVTPRGRWQRVAVDARGEQTCR